MRNLSDGLNLWTNSHVLSELVEGATARVVERSGLVSDSFRAFQERYRHDPAGFVKNCIRFKPNEAPAPYQIEILEELTRCKREAVRGPHGPGKTALAAWVVHWAILTADDVKVPTTASAWRHLSKFLWPEIHKWAKYLRWDEIGRDPYSQHELLTLSLRRSPTCEAFAVASDNPALIEGAHAERVVYIYEEAKEIPKAIWDASEGAFSGAGADTEMEAYALALSTPGEPLGRFYEIFSRKSGLEDWNVRHITLQEAIAAGRISQEWAEQRKRQWGKESAIYQNRVEGNFASSEEVGIIPLSWVELAVERWRAWDEEGRPGDFRYVGVDVARGGDDKTVLAPRYENAIAELRKFARADTMITAGRVVAILKAYGGLAIVDVIGIGAGVVDRLRELGLEVEAFNASEKTDFRDRSGEWGFINKRSAAWWNLREMLDPANEEEVALPPDDELIGDLTAPRWRPVSGGKIKVESKDDIKKRLGRSTDCGDAVVQAFWGRTRILFA